MDSRGTDRVVRASRLAKAVTRCPFCHELVDISFETASLCSRCHAPHHRSCWSESGVCATCRESSSRQLPTSRPSRGLRRRRAVYWAFAAVWAVVALAGPIIVETVAYKTSQRSFEQARSRPPVRTDVRPSRDSAAVHETYERTMREIEALREKRQQDDRRLAEARRKEDERAQSLREGRQRVAAKKLAAEEPARDDWAALFPSDTSQHVDALGGSRSGSLGEYWEEARRTSPSTVGMTDKEIELFEAMLERKQLQRKRERR